MDKDYIIENELIGLYSLLPLMKVKNYETPDEIIEETVKAIETIEDGALKGDIFAAMSILSSQKYSSELVKKYVRREMLMNSPLFEEWVREEREEAAKKARLETEKDAKKDSIVEVLIGRFDFVPDKIIEELNKIESLQMINQLLKKSIKVTTLDEFSKILERITK